MTFKLKVLAAAITMGFSFGANAAVVDLFTTAQSVSDLLGGGATSNSVSGAGIVGGERDVSVDVITSPIGLGATASVASGYLSLNSQSGVAGNLVVQWDGVDGSMALGSGLSLDLTDGNPIASMGFVIRTYNADSPFTFSLGAYSAGGASSVILLNGHTTAGFIAAGVPSYIPLTGFQACGFVGGDVLGVTCSGSVDLTQISALELRVYGTADLDLTVGSASSSQVPEPAVLALLGSSLFGLAAFRRRKQD